MLKLNPGVPLEIDAYDRANDCGNGSSRLGGNEESLKRCVGRGIHRGFVSEDSRIHSDKQIVADC